MKPERGRDTHRTVGTCVGTPPRSRTRRRTGGTVGRAVLRLVAHPGSSLRLNHTGPEREPGHPSTWTGEPSSGVVGSGQSPTGESCRRFSLEAPDEGWVEVGGSGGERADPGPLCTKSVSVQTKGRYPKRGVVSSPWRPEERDRGRGSSGLGHTTKNLTPDSGGRISCPSKGL